MALNHARLPVSPLAFGPVGLPTLEPSSEAGSRSPTLFESTGIIHLVRFIVVQEL